MSVVRDDALFCATVRTRDGRRIEVSVGGVSPAIHIFGPGFSAAVDVDVQDLLWLQAIIGEAIGRERARR